MVRSVKAQEKEKKKTGRKPKLIVEDQILIMLEYLREYRTLYHISLTWKMSESNVCRIVHKIENILIKSGQFRLRGKKELWQSSSEGEMVVMDVMESQIERPKKRQKQFYSGKQKAVQRGLGGFPHERLHQERTHPQNTIGNSTKNWSNCVFSQWKRKDS